MKPPQRRRQRHRNPADLAHVAADKGENLEKHIGSRLEGIDVFLRQRNAGKAARRFAQGVGYARRFAFVDPDTHARGQQRLDRRHDDRDRDLVLVFHQRHVHTEHGDRIVIFVQQQLEHLAAFGLPGLGGGDAAKFPIAEDLGHVGFAGFASGICLLGDGHCRKREAKDGNRGRQGF